AFGQLSAEYVAAAVVITVSADVAKHLLLDCAIRHHNSTDLITAAAAASIVKWCASLLALGGILTTVGIFLRAWAAMRRWVRDGVSALAARWRWLGACLSALTWPWRWLRTRACNVVARSRYFR